MNEMIVQNDKGLATYDSMTLSGKPLTNLLVNWAQATTNKPRKEDKMRDKGRAVLDFVQQTGVPPWLAVEEDVLDWHAIMGESEEPVKVVYLDGTEVWRTKPLAERTIYRRHGEVARFWKWLKEHKEYGPLMSDVNPFEHTRPNTPKAYKGAKALTDEELNELLRVVRDEAEVEDKLVAKRDYALLLFFVLTGRRREEVLRLTWGDLKRTNGTVQVSFLVKGGDYSTEETNVLCYDALLDYLDAADRKNDMAPDEPLWRGHDRAGQSTGALSSHAFAKNLKRYGRDAGLESIHVHQLRHTVARMVGEDSGDLGEVQKVLGHKNQQTTRIYLRQVATKKDTHSAAIRARLGL